MEILHLHVEKHPPEALSDGLMRNQSASYRLKLKTSVSFIRNKMGFMGFMARLILSKIRLLQFFVLFTSLFSKEVLDFRRCWRFFVEPAFCRYFPLPNI